MLAFGATIRGMDICVPEQEIVKKMVEIKNRKKSLKYSGIIQEQLAEGKIPSVLKKKDEMLFRCCTRPHYTPLLEQLLKQKLLDPNTLWQPEYTTYSCRLLTDALYHDTFENAHCLLECGADPNAEGRASDGDCKNWILSPLCIAIKKRNIRILELLLNRYHVNPNQQYGQEEWPLLFAIEEYDSKKYWFGDGRDCSAARVAIVNQIKQMIKILLKAGAKPEAVGKPRYHGGIFCEYTAVSFAQKLNLPEIVEILQTPPDQLKLQHNA